MGATAKEVTARRLPVLLFVALVSSLSAQDFARADEIPLPGWGIVRFDGSGLEHMGYSPSQGAILFRRYGSTEGLGGNPDIDYILVDPSTGEIVREIPVNINLFATGGDPTDEEAWAELERQNDEMAEAAEREVARISDLDDRSHADALYGTGGVVRCTESEEFFDVPDPVFRYYAFDETTGWLKPIHESQEYAYQPDAVSFRRSSLTGGGTMLMLEFFRSPVMEFDTGTQIFFIFSEEQTAQFYNEVGFAHYGKKDYPAALNAFAMALDSFPDYSKSAYNAACTAALLRDVETSLRYLRELGRIRAERVDDYAVAADSHLQQVDRDTDFDGIRSNARFISGLKEIRGR